MYWLLVLAFGVAMLALPAYVWVEMRRGRFQSSRFARMVLSPVWYLAGSFVAIVGIALR